MVSILFCILFQLMANWVRIFYILLLHREISSSSIKAGKPASETVTHLLRSNISNAIKWILFINYLQTTWLIICAQDSIFQLINLTFHLLFSSPFAAQGKKLVIRPFKDNYIHVYIMRWTQTFIFMAISTGWATSAINFHSVTTNYPYNVDADALQL